MKEPVKFYIRTISPIHIGCDEVYEPTSFVLDENVRQMIVFDPLSFISKMGDDDKIKFSQICARGSIASILEIYKFMRDKTVEGRAVGVCHDFLDHYRQTLSMPLRNQREIQQNLNNFAIPRTAFRNIDQRPYIPGSSLKGALRTAYLNLMESEKKLSQRGKERNAKKLEQRLMEYDGIPSDPFRMVKVSDFMPVSETRTRIVYGVNEKKKQTDRDARGLPLIFEVVPPGSDFVGTIAVDSPPHGSDIRKHVSIEKLLSSTIFYTKEKQREDKELSDIGVVTNSENSRFQGQKNSFLIRVGRHSGAESVTIEGHRNIFIMGKRGEKKHLKHATTLWLASEERKPQSNKYLSPFGWAVMAQMNPELSRKSQEEKAFLEDNRQKQQILFQRHEKREEGQFIAELGTGAQLPQSKGRVHQLSETSLEKLIKELDLVKANDMGRIGTVIQKIDTLETDAEKGAIAKAIRYKIGAKAFKKHKRKEYLVELIKKAKQ